MPKWGHKLPYEAPVEPKVGYRHKDFGWQGPNKADKGHKAGSCNITACQREGAFWFNKGMNAYYCSKCAKDINKFPLSDGTVLCSKDFEAELIYLKSIGLVD